MAVAQEQEMVALEQEMRARVVEAEAEVPRAMAQALREGQAWRDGLLQHAEPAGRYYHAQVDL